MTTFLINSYIYLIIWATSCACAVLGVFLVLRRMALISDGISHSILLGIVVFAFLSKSLTSPLLIIGAGLSGILFSLIIEFLNKTKIIKEDSAIGIVYPFFFSIAVILINIFEKNTHLDTHTILIGDISFAVFDQLSFFGRLIGPKSFYLSFFLFLINIGFVLIFYKELKVVTFDPLFAKSIGISLIFFHYTLMSLVSFTVISAFNAVGSILVIAFIIGPPASAFLLTKRFKNLLILSIIIAIISSSMGIALAFFLKKVSVSGCVAMSIGICFCLCAFFSPLGGIFSQIKKRKHQKKEFKKRTLLIHLLNHYGKKEAIFENTISNLIRHFRWKEKTVYYIVKIMIKEKLITQKNNEDLFLTKKGKGIANQLK